VFHFAAWYVYFFTNKILYLTWSDGGFAISLVAFKFDFGYICIFLMYRIRGGICSQFHRIMYVLMLIFLRKKCI